LVVKGDHKQKPFNSSHTQKNKRTAVGKRGKNCEEPQKIAKILPRHQKYTKLDSNKRAEPTKITKITKHPSQIPNEEELNRLNKNHKQKNVTQTTQTNNQNT
jgi:hypothetical protein